MFFYTSFCVPCAIHNVYYTLCIKMLKSKLTFVLLVEFGGLILVQFNVFGFDKVEAIFEDDVSDALHVNRKRVN